MDGRLSRSNLWTYPLILVSECVFQEGSTGVREHDAFGLPTRTKRLRAERSARLTFYIRVLLKWEYAGRVISRRSSTGPPTVKWYRL